MTERPSRQHVARFILIGMYTGTRAAAICRASFVAGPGRGYIDLDAGLDYRKAPGARETNKKQPPVRLAHRLVGHMRRWRANGQKYPVEWYGQPVSRVSKSFRNTVAAAGLEKDVTPHCLRHTAATWAMQSGLAIVDAAAMLGMTIRTLEKHYGHHHPDFQKSAAAAMGRSPGRRR